MRTPFIIRGCLTLTLCSVLGVSACGSDADTIEGAKSPSNANGGGAGTSNGTGGGGPGGGGEEDGGASPGTQGGGGDQPSSATLPYDVDKDYVPSGYMGDTVAIMAKPSMADPDATCGGNAAPNANGSMCHTFSYSPKTKDTAWAGVYWQYPANNWTAPGLAIEAGAQKITFYARANAPLKVEFLAGMDKGPDGWKVSKIESVGTTWQAYSIDLSTTSYTSVAGAFGWSIDSTAQGSMAPYTLYIDAITWTR